MTRWKAVFELQLFDVVVFITKLKLIRNIIAYKCVV